jgi:LysM repeat protein
MLRPLISSLALTAVLGLAAPVAAAPTTRPAAAKPATKKATQTHLVFQGQRLASIAKRYNVTVAALCNANDINERDTIRPGQRLTIPDRSDKDGSLARAARLATERPAAASTLAATGKPTTMRASLERSAGRRRSGPSWAIYSRAPRKKGYLSLTTHGSKWRGSVLDANGKLRPAARKAISQLLGATGDHPGVPDRLIHLMVDVSDTFGGRPLHIVSGYRASSYFRDSRHKTSQAIDFAVVGVPNASVRDYLLTRTSVGVGFYPNSSFLHLDVRPRNTYWVDYAGPGEAPRRRPRGYTPAPTPVDFDDRAEEAAATRSPSPGDSLPAVDAVSAGEEQPTSIPAALPEVLPAVSKTAPTLPVVSRTAPSEAPRAVTPEVTAAPRTTSAATTSDPSRP